MARGKKEELTLEEKLERALVPVGEQPYEVPGNWCWTRLKVVSEVVTGSTPSKKRTEYYGEEFPFFKPTDLDAGRKIMTASEYLSSEGKKISRVIPAKSTAVCCIGSIGKSGYLEVDGTTNQQINSVIPRINPLYLYYFINTEMFINELRGKSSATTISIVNKSKMEQNFVPLPPLLEQQRIVEQIESLFAKLHEISEKVKSVFEQYKKDRATLIHKAYIGELTKHWRKESGIDKSWEQIKIKELCKSLKYGTSKKSKEKGTMIVVRMGNLQNGEIIWDNLAYTDDNEDIEKYMLEKGDVLFNRTNSSEWVGKTSIYRGEYPAIYAGYLIKLDYYRDKVIGDFLNYMLNSPKAKEYCNLVKTDGVNQSNINAKKIGEFVIPVPSLEEQKEIVRILDIMSIKQKRILELVEEVMEEIVLMKKSILSKAFRGKLSTNNSEEESSIELLKKILVET